MRKAIVEVELVNVEFLNSLKSFQFINEVSVTSSGPLHCVMKKCLTNYHAKNQEKLNTLRVRYTVKRKVNVTCRDKKLR